MASPLFEHIANQQGPEWGHVLDAGTGLNSLGWLSSVPSRSLTAVTGAKSMFDSLQQNLGNRLRAQDRLCLGNWADPELLAGERFDVVVADYLLGAIEGFAPYWQDQLFLRLRPMVGQRLYVVGLEPYVPTRPDTDSGKMVCEIGRLRDACLLLAGERPYREYPATWALRQLQLAGFKPLSVRHFPIRYGTRFIDGQLDMCLKRLERLADHNLVQGLEQHIAQLRQRAHGLHAQQQGLAYGADYVIVAEPEGNFGQSPHSV